MAYASITDVQARAGALAAWNTSSKPSLGQIAGFIDDVAADIDAALAGRGLSISDDDSVAARALKSVNALGALVLALQATYPEGSGPSSAPVAATKAEFEALMGSIVDGTHPAIAALEAGDVQHRAASFWENEPLYGLFPTDPNFLSPYSPDSNPSTRPTVTRGTSL